mgnify:CR=1 FL=1
MSQRDPLVILGRISGLFGVAGWVRVYSYTDPRENILSYQDWQLSLADGWRRWRMTDGRRQGKAVVARLDGVDDRDQARELIGCDIAVPRSALPPVAEGEYYWADLQGLRVYNTDGTDLGLVTRLMETGANDVLVVEGERERLIPMVPGAFVLRVEPESGFLEVDWDPDF